MEVLIVEDDSIVTRLHKFHIKNNSIFEPKVFENGKKVLEYLDEKAENKNKFLILLDLNMPVMNGWDFLDTCRSRHYIHQLYIVIVTSSSYKADSEKAADYDRVLAYYQKPLTVNNVKQIFNLKEVVSLVV